MAKQPPKKFAGPATIVASKRAKLAAEIDAEIRHYQRCRALLRRVDATVLEAGRELFEDSPGLGLWLCSPARALGEEVPLDAMRTKEGREKVANILRAVAYGVYL